MLKRLGFATALAVFAVATLEPAPASAQSTKVVDTRHQVMRTFGGTLKSVGDWVKSGNGNPAALEASVLMLAAVTGDLPGLFPRGTSSEDLGLKVSGAKPEIWMKWEAFQQAAATLGVEGRKLAAAIRDGDKDAVGKQLGDTGKVGCGGCHQSFRSKRPN